VFPPAAAGWVKVTVHVVAASGARFAGEHARPDTAGVGVTVTLAVALPPSVAVTVTACEVATVPAVAENVAVVAAAGTVTDAGTGSAALLFEASATTLPPVGAG